MVSMGTLSEGQSAADESQARPTLRFLTCGATDDGKSTVIGRLLYDLLIAEDNHASLAGGSKKEGAVVAEIDYTPLVEGLKVEGQQGNPFEVVYRCFSTKRRAFVVADTLGQERYTRQVTSGASSADLAVLLVDARKGLLAQTRCHTIIASLMGIRHVLLAINKMDLIEFDEGIFSKIAAEFSQFASTLAFKTIAAIPVSARFGDNVALRSQRMPWYTGPTLLDFLETIEVGTDRTRAPLRLPVQSINRLNSEFRGIAGTVVGGRVEVGDDVVILPSGHQTRVQAIYGPTGEVSGAKVGDAVTLTLADKLDVARGDIIVAPRDRAQVADQFGAHLIWMSEARMLPGRTYLMKINHNEVSAAITDLKYRVDVGSLAKLASKTLSLNEIGVCNLSLNRAVVFDAYEQNRETGSFILIDYYSNETVAMGTIDFPLRRASNIHHQRLTISKIERTQLMQHRTAVLWFTGLPGAGKSTIANLVETKLHARGIHTALLDGDNVRHGLNRDLGFTEPDRVENIRRIGEVAKLMTEAGLVVLCSFISPFRAERRMVKELLGTGEFLEIFVDTPLERCQARDPKGLYRRALAGEIKNFTGVDQPYEVPEAPDLRLAAGEESAETLAQQVVEELLRRSAI